MSGAITPMNRGPLRKRLIAALILIPMTAPAMFAQLPTATILGVVRDASGAVVPDAALTARNVDTGQTRTTVTAADGSYRIPALPVGNYEVRAEHPGFQSELRGGLTLTVSQEAVVNMTLQVGAVEQTVAVTAEAPLVNTTSGSLGGLVSEEKVAELPLNGRNYIDLTLLQTGVSEQKAVVRNTGYVGTYFSSNGAPVRSNNYLLDGAIMVNLWGVSSASATSSTLGVDAIREYRVITNSFSAEYGMSMGSQMVIVSKGGTNNFHGDLFEYLRNSALDARNFFDYKTPATQRRLPEFIRNNFGGAIGGPIKKDKTFFFGVLEAVRQRLGVTTISNTIPASARVDGAVAPQIAPVIKPLMALFPDPNLPGNQFTFPFTQPASDNYGQVRADQNFSSRDSLFVRYTVQDTQQTVSLAFPEFKTAGSSRNQFATISENRVFSPTLLNTFRFSLSRTNLDWNSADAAEATGPQVSLVPGLPVGTIGIGGLTSLGSDGTAPRVHKQNIFTWSDDLFDTRGSHSLKFGALINHYQQVIENAASFKGSASFANLAGFLSGAATSISALTPGSSIERTYHFNTLGFYAQDDWRIRSNFTLNLGLRYEFSTVPFEAHGQYSVIKDVRNDSSFTVTSSIFENPTLRNFSPRFGFAWDVKGDGKTAVRGAFSVLYDLSQAASLLLQSQISTPPFSLRNQTANPAVLTVPLTFPASAASVAPRPIDWHIQQPHMLDYNLTLERQLPFDMALTLAYAGSRGINLIQGKEGNPTVPQILPDGRQFWAVGLPRINSNFGTMDLFAAGANSWYNALQFGLLKRLGKGLQFQSSYTWSRVIDENAGAAYGEDTASTNADGADPTHRQVDRGLAYFDLTQVWKLNTIYQLPSPISSRRAAAKLLNGWWISGILTLQSGQPFTPCLQSNRSRSGVQGGGTCDDRPDLVAGRNSANITQGASTGCSGVSAGTPVRKTNRFFDPCAFTIPAAGFLGTAGRDILRGQGFANLDFSLVKDTTLRYLGESGKLQFRAEVFNILNRANFGLPNRTVFAGAANVEPPLPTAGVITNTLGTSRQIQLALKILF